MSEREHENKQEPVQDEVTPSSGLVDVFDDEETRRFRLSDLDTKHPDEESEDEYQIEERDYHPIRFRRDSRIIWLDMSADPVAKASEIIEKFLAE